MFKFAQQPKLTSERFSLIQPPRQTSRAGNRLKLLVSMCVTRQQRGGGRSRLTRTQFPHPPTTATRHEGPDLGCHNPDIFTTNHAVRPLNPNRMSATFFKRRFVVRGPQRDDPFLHSPSFPPRPHSCRRGHSRRGAGKSRSRSNLIQRKTADPLLPPRGRQ